MSRMEVAIKLIQEITEKLDAMENKLQEQTKLIDRISSLVDEIDNRV